MRPHAFGLNTLAHVCTHVQRRTHIYVYQTDLLVSRGIFNSARLENLVLSERREMSRHHIPERNAGIIRFDMQDVPRIACGDLSWI